MNIPAFSNRPGFTPGRFVSASARPALAAALSAALVAGCSDSKPAPGVNYDIRGVITALPQPGKVSSHLMIHHEAIPTFTTKGKVVGMNEMTMPFPTAPDLSLAGLAVGDPILFTLEVRENPGMKYQIIKISKLPADTALNFKSPPPGPSAGPSAGEPPATAPATPAAPPAQPDAAPKPR